MLQTVYLLYCILKIILIAYVHCTVYIVQCALQAMVGTFTLHIVHSKF